MVRCGIGHGSGLHAWLLTWCYKDPTLQMVLCYKPHKTLLYWWKGTGMNFKFDCLEKSYCYEIFLLIKLQIKHVNKRILMRPPDFLTRLPRDMEKHFKNLKGVYIIT